MPDPVPGPGQAVVEVAAAGVNFIDVYQRTGLYPAQALPRPMGLEGAGVVRAVADDVKDLRPGQLVAWTDVPGSYAEQVVASAERLVPVPDGVSAEVAAAVMLQGMTAHYLVSATRPLGRGEWCLVHAAAGGVGLLLCQLANERGAGVIGTCSSDEKAERARAAGARHVIRYDQEDFPARVADLTGGAGVAVAYDSVGQATWRGSLDCLATRGMLVLFGQSSGPVESIDPKLLAARSLYFTRPSLFHYASRREELVHHAGEVLSRLARGALEVRIDRSLALDQAGEAHRLLEGRATSGKVLLVP